jgi:hypothetical protein
MWSNQSDKRSVNCMSDTFGDSHRAAAKGIAGVAFICIGAVNLTLGAANHKELLLTAGVLQFVAGVLLLRIKKLRPNSPTSLGL